MTSTTKCIGNQTYLMNNDMFDYQIHSRFWIIPYNPYDVVALVNIDYQIR